MRGPQALCFSACQKSPRTAPRYPARLPALPGEMCRRSARVICVLIVLAASTPAQDLADIQQWPSAALRCSASKRCSRITCSQRQAIAPQQHSLAEPSNWSAAAASGEAPALCCWACSLTPQEPLAAQPSALPQLHRLHCRLRTVLPSLFAAAAQAALPADGSAACALLHVHWPPCHSCTAARALPCPLSLLQLHRLQLLHVHALSAAAAQAAVPSPAPRPLCGSSTGCTAPCTQFSLL